MWWTASISYLEWNLAFDETTEVELPITDQNFWDHAQFANLFMWQLLKLMA